MKDPESAQDIDIAASEWAARVDAGGLDPSTEAALQAWLSGDPRRRGAFARAQAGLRLLELAYKPREPEAAAPSAPVARPGASRRRPLGLGLAAAMVLAVGVGGGVAIGAFSPADRLRTRLGEERPFTLEDGSVAFLNTDSRVTVSYRPDKRSIAVGRGEAWFQVAKSHERPFVVDIGKVHVRATGTAFSVRRLQDHAVEVLVSEGRVRAWTDTAPGETLVISAGHATIISPKTSAATAVLVPSRPEEDLAWRDGEILLRGETIAAAAAEFNRYNKTKIRIADAELSNQKVIGYFKLNRPDEFAKAVIRISGGEMTNDGNNIVVKYSQN